MSKKIKLLIDSQDLNAFEIEEMFDGCVELLNWAYHGSDSGDLYTATSKIAKVFKLDEKQIIGERFRTTNEDSC